MRELLIVRHAIAHERDAQRFPDDEQRPLTPRGKKRFKAAAAALPALFERPDELLTSSLTRAKQTARLLHREAGYPKPRVLRELRPEIETRELIAALRARRAKRMVVVGHEPALSQLLAELLGAGRTVETPMKKGGVALVRFKRQLAAGQGVLSAFIPPRVLRSSER